MFNWERFKPRDERRILPRASKRAIRASPRIEARELLERSGGQHITVVHEE